MRIESFITRVLRRIAHRIVAEEHDALSAANEEIAALHRKNGELAEENARLSRLVRTTPTPAEIGMLDLVKAEPGLPAKVYARRQWDATIGMLEWAKNIKDPRTDDEAKRLGSLYRLGLVRREKEGQSFRYWPVDAA